MFSGWTRQLENIPPKSSTSLLLRLTSLGEAEACPSLFCLRRSEPSGEFGQRAGAMGNAVFYLGAQLAKSLVVAGGKKQGIVTESVLSLGVFGDLSLASSGEELDWGFVCGGMREQGEDAAKSCGSFFAWHGSQQGEEFGFVLFVGCVAVGCFGGKSCGANSRRTVQCVHFETGVICEKPNFRMRARSALKIGVALQPLAQLPHFQSGVGFKAGAGFRQFRWRAELAHSKDCGFWPQYPLDFPNFVGISAGDDKQ